MCSNIYRNGHALWRKRFAVFIALCPSIAVSADTDFTLPKIPRPVDRTFDLKTVAGQSSYYDFMHSQLGPCILKFAPQATGPETNQSELKAGHGVTLKLSQFNFNIHVNYPNTSEGGRSYGWTRGEVGDWSDEAYLDHLAAALTVDDAEEVAKFYKLLIRIVGACNADDKALSIETLANPTQRVATNFLAIYTAEEYRAMAPVQPHQGWDDALFQVTLLAAFHSGQQTLTKYYVALFSNKSKKQGPGVYRGPNADRAAPKDAELNDYWQDSANPNSRQSGINETRGDFVELGQKITKYAKSSGNRTLANIEAVVGESDNVIQAISQYFTNGRSKNISQIDNLANDVADLMMKFREDADKITAWIQQGN
jgi:hypothetical protein